MKVVKEDSDSQNKLEGKFLYRLIKVLYFLALIVVGSCVLFLGWGERPIRSINREESYLICQNRYRLSETNVYPDEARVLSGHQNDEARELCISLFRSKALATGASNYEIDEFLRSRASDISKHSLDLQYEIKGSWGDAFRFWSIGLALAYFTLTLIRKTLLYVVFGEKFSWEI